MSSHNTQSIDDENQKQENEQKEEDNELGDEVMKLQNNLRERKSQTPSINIIRSNNSSIQQSPNFRMKGVNAIMSAEAIDRRLIQDNETRDFITKFYSFSILICVISGVGCICDLIWISLYGEFPPSYEIVFIIIGIIFSIFYCLFMYFLRKHWPVNVFLMCMFWLCFGFIVGFLTCTHLKLLIRTIDKHDQ